MYTIGSNIGLGKYIDLMGSVAHANLLKDKPVAFFQIFDKTYPMRIVQFG